MNDNTVVCYNKTLPRPGLARGLVLGLAAAALYGAPLAAQSYSEDFNNNSAPGWSVASGTWSAGSQVYTQTANVLNAITTYGDDTWSTNYIYTAKVRSAWGGSGNRVGLVFNYVTSSNYAYVHLSRSGLVVLGRVTSGTPYGTTSVVEESTFGGADVDEWITVQVIREGSNTTVRIDGQEVADMVDVALSSLGAGTVGLMANWNETGDFDDVSVGSILPAPWQTGDIGTVGAAGDAGFDNGEFTVAGAGAGIFGTSDEFRFVHQPLSGDGSIVARVDSVQDVAGSNWEHAGIMIRESLAVGSKYAGVYCTPTSGVLFETRTTTGGSSTGPASAPGIHPPRWLRLVRAGSTLTAARSDDGTTWTTLGSETIAMTGTVYSGLAVTSEVDATTCTATFSNVSVVAGDFSAPTVAITAPADQATVSGTIAVAATASDNVGVVGVQFKLNGANLGAEDMSSPYTISWDTTTVADAQHVLTAVGRDAAANTTTSAGILVDVSNSLASPWAAQDVGAVGAAGSASHAGGTFTVSGAGTGIFGASDEFHFVHQPITGDCSIVVRVAGLQDVAGSVWEHAGVMIRDNLSGTSAYSGLYVTPTNGLLFEARSANGGNGVGVANNSTVGPPRWLRLVRSGNTFTASHSTDGITWNTVGSHSATMAATVYIGLAVTSEVDATLSTATFDNVTVVPGTGGFKTAFPRLGGAQIGSKDYNDPVYMAHIAKLDLAILGFYKGWTGVSGFPSMTIQQCVQQIKALNPAIIIGNYTIFEAQSWNTENLAAQDLHVKLYGATGPTGNGGSWTPNDWWAHTQTGDTIVKPDAFLRVVNSTDFVTPDANGRRWPQWFADWCNTNFFSPVPEFDIWYMDNFFWKPRYDADWDRDGSDDSQNDPAVRTYFRQGNLNAVNAISALQPGIIVMGNVDGATHLNPAGGHLRETQYNQLIGASLLESPMGHSWSEEGNSWGGWYNMMASYRSQLQNTKAPHLVLWTVATTSAGLCYHTAHRQNYGSGDPENPELPEPYAFMRYALASALLDNGYIMYHTGGYNSDNVVWFDEFDLDGTATTSWLGAAIDPPQTNAYQNGVFRRRFENGMAIVNPRTNPDKSLRTAQTITPEAGYKRFVGSQAPSVNNGQNVTSISIDAGDGIILIKQ